MGNIALIDDGITIFDGIEFNDEMRWIDVMSDVAFVVMDLQDRNRFDLASRFLSAYLERTADYAGLGVLRFYLAYRAMVRAKVACLRASQIGRQSQVDSQQTAVASPESSASSRRPEDAGQTFWTEYRTYVDLAKRYSEQPHPSIIITHGVAGSGKTTISQTLLESCGGLPLSRASADRRSRSRRRLALARLAVAQGAETAGLGAVIAVRIRTDVERKRLYGLEAGARSASPCGGGLYTSAATEHTYQRVCALARLIVDAGDIAIIDGAFLKRWQRDLFRHLASERDVPFVIVACSASGTTLIERIRARARLGRDASEADVDVLEHQLATEERLGSDEHAVTVEYDADVPPDRALVFWRAVFDRLGSVDLARH